MSAAADEELALLRAEQRQMQAELARLRAQVAKLAAELGVSLDDA
jgi:uncharacterized protein